MGCNDDGEKIETFISLNAFSMKCSHSANQPQRPARHTKITCVQGTEQKTTGKLACSYTHGGGDTNICGLLTKFLKN